MNDTKPDPQSIALDIIDTLRSRGHVAYLAGGCVRDKLLGRVPKDYDVGTDATPQAVQKVFPRARLVGAKFGVVLVRRKGLDVEVATFRSDGTYQDGRHPDSVTFGSEEDDAQRRDFTINGLFYDPSADRIIDHVGGQADLQAQCLRTIGAPDRRFAEDHLRMLRAVRLAARLGFRVHQETMSAIRRLGPQLRLISPERIWMELEEVLSSPTRGQGWSLLGETELIGHIAPPWHPPADQMTVIGKRLSALPSQTIDPALGLAALLVDTPSVELDRFCRHLKLSNRDRAWTTWLVRSLPATSAPDALELADLKILMAHYAWPLLTDLLSAWLEAEDKPQTAHARLLARAAALPPESVDPPPLITGDDLLARGATSGPAMGQVLAQLRRDQLNEKLSDSDEAMRRALAMLGLDG